MNFFGEEEVKLNNDPEKYAVKKLDYWTTMYKENKLSKNELDSLVKDLEDEMKKAHDTIEDIDMKNKIAKALITLKTLLQHASSVM